MGHRVGVPRGSIPQALLYVIFEMSPPTNHDGRPDSEVPVFRGFPMRSPTYFVTRMAGHALSTPRIPALIKLEHALSWLQLSSLQLPSFLRLWYETRFSTGYRIQDTGCSSLSSDNNVAFLRLPPILRCSVLSVSPRPAYRSVRQL